MANYVFLLPLVFVSVLYIPVASSISVPKEWHPAIDALCKQAELGFFSHPSPHGQVLQGSFTPSLLSQVNCAVAMSAACTVTGRVGLYYRI